MDSCIFMFPVTETLHNILRIISAVISSLSRVQRFVNMRLSVEFLLSEWCCTLCLTVVSFCVYLLPFFFCTIQNNLYFSIKQTLNILTAVLYCLFQSQSFTICAYSFICEEELDRAEFTKEFLECPLPFPVAILGLSQQRKEGRKQSRPSWTSLWSTQAIGAENDVMTRE